MELIKYRKTLDVHKNGVQFMLQGFQTADNMSRVIEISLMASGDAIDFPLERIVAMMYVTTPGAEEPSINSCTIKDNKVIYDVLPIVEEGITKMRLKIIEASPDGAKRVLCAPEFAVEVTKSGTDDESAEQTTTFTALEDAVSKAKTVYDERFLRMELTSDCIFKAYYADGTTYETDILQKLFLNGNVELSKSYAMGGTGVRAGEDTDNSKYYSNVSKSEALNAKDIMENSEEILEEVRLHGVYTAFKVDFETGNVEYVSPSFKFKVNMETGELETEGQSYTFDDEIGRVVSDWLKKNNIVLEDLQKMATEHGKDIKELKEVTQAHTEEINKPRPIEKGGTGATTKEEARTNLEITPENIGVPEYLAWNVEKNVGNICIAPGYLYFGGSTKKDTTTVKESTLTIPIINSGSVYLEFDVKVEIESSKITNSKVMMYINDEYIETLTESVGIQKLSKSCEKLLTVKKGDVLKLVGHMELPLQSGSTSEYASFEINNLRFKANIDTPYKYIAITHDENIGAILDELLGMGN